MNSTILGCGASSGVPALLCECQTCVQKDPKNIRQRASIVMQIEGKDILIDTSVDFRLQAFQSGIKKIDAILYTHPHADHINGIDDVKMYNFKQKKAIPCFGHTWTQSELMMRFPYVFRDQDFQAESKPTLSFHLIDPQKETFLVEGLLFTPLVVDHGPNTCLGYRYGSFAYVTDCHHISDASLERLENLDVLILDCLRFTSSKSHFTFEQALHTIRQLTPKTTILTHMSHDIDYHRHKDLLPKGVFFGFDMLKI